MKKLMINNFEHLDSVIVACTHEYKIGEILSHFYKDGPGGYEKIESPTVIIANATEKEWVEQSINFNGLDPEKECPWILETNK
jgi:hypothetical protein